MNETDRYSQSGVNYTSLDSLKRLAQQASRETSQNLPAGIKDVPVSLGETARVIDIGPFLLATVDEGLGTKNLVADSLAIGGNETRYDQIGWDTVAMIVNDVTSVGARPITVNAKWSFGSSRFLEKYPQKGTDLIRGWKEACNAAGALWAAGETSTLQGIIYPSRMELSGSAIGIIDPKSHHLTGEKLVPGDHIVIIGSSGVAANGLTLIREIAKSLPDGFKTKLPSGRTFGEKILKPTHIYVRLVEQLFGMETDLHYISHITGHGWRKIMRANRELSYIIHSIPEPIEEFRFIQEAGNVSDKNMYETFNMGAGLAMMVPERDVRKVHDVAKKLAFDSWDAGIVENGPRQVVIHPKNLIYPEDSLQIRNL